MYIPHTCNFVISIHEQMLMLCTEQGPDIILWGRLEWGSLPNSEEKKL